MDDQMWNDAVFIQTERLIEFQRNYPDKIIMLRSLCCTEGSTFLPCPSRLLSRAKYISFVRKNVGFVAQW